MCPWDRHGKAKYENGGFYEGDFENDVRSGWGKHEFPDGSWYEGEWSADRMTGESARLNLPGSDAESAFASYTTSRLLA